VRITYTAVTFTAVLALGASSATAATTVGSNLSAQPTDPIAFAATLINGALPASSIAPAGLAAPGPGVITSWAMRSGEPSAANNTVRIRVISGNLAVASGRVHTAPDAAGVYSFAERLPISAGEHPALEIASTGGPVAVSTAAFTPSAIFGAWTSPFADGESRPPDSGSPGELLLQATIEPDADADGFGDETQDGCQGESGPRGGCPEPPALPAAPETQIDSGPKKRIAKPKARFQFSSPSAGASFECALDRGGFSDCASPHRLRKLETGAHRFRVRAVSSAGLIDRSPAEQAFKVKRRK
jgi:hypothetical protein